LSAQQQQATLEGNRGRAELVTQFRDLELRGADAH